MRTKEGEGDENGQVREIKAKSFVFFNLQLEFVVWLLDNIDFWDRSVPERGTNGQCDRVEEVAGTLEN